MKFFRNLSIKYKLIVIILGVTTVTVVLSFIIMIISNIKMLRKEMIAQTTTGANLVGLYSASPLIFDDIYGAEMALQKLQTIPNITVGAIYTNDGKLFASYFRDNKRTALPSAIYESTTLMFAGSLEIFHPIIYQNKRYGTIYLKASTEFLRKKIRRNIVYMLLLLVVIIIVTYFISAYIQKLISVPILKLAEVSERVSKRGDYSLRAPLFGDDEVGTLAESFNNMLEQIELRAHQRDKAEKALRESETNYRSIFNGVNDAIFIHDLQTGDILDVNLKAVELYGFSREEMQKMGVPGLSANIKPYREQEALKYIREAVEGTPQVFEWLAKKKDGSLFWVEVSLKRSEFRGKENLLAVVRDISDRKLQEEEQKNYLERIQLQQQAMIVLTTLEFISTSSVKESMQFITKTAAEAVAAERVSIWFFNENLSVLECIDLYEKNKKEHSSGMTVNMKAHQMYMSTLLRGLPIDAHDAIHDYRTASLAESYLLPNKIDSLLDSVIKISGKPVGVVRIEHVGKAIEWHDDEMSFSTAIADQTALTIMAIEQLKVMEELKKARNYVQNIINSMPSILVGVSREGTVTLWNKPAEDHTGIPAQEAINRPFRSLFPELSIENENIKTSINKKKPHKESKIAINKGGETYFYDVSIYPLITNGVDGAVIRIDDVSERVKIEEMMIQSEKMLSVGGLAAGMAHEINNPLAGILQNIQVIQNRFSDSLPKNLRLAEELGVPFDGIRQYVQKRGIEEMIKAIVLSGKRAAQIVENMLSFSRKSASKFAPQDISALLDNTLYLAENDYDLKKKYDFRQITIVKEYAEDLPPVPCERNEIQQVFFNILRNGAQAMAEYKTKKQKENIRFEPRFKLKIYGENDFLCTEISDNGPGIPEKIRKRIFEPFFTTKGVGLGTGLGLSVSYFIIVENHGGKLEVESNIGEGTKFTIKLPVKGITTT